MADTDVSFYPTKFPDQVNPLEMVGKYQGIQNQMLQGQLLQQQIPEAVAHAQAAQMDVAADQEFAKLLDANTSANGDIDVLNLKSAVAKNLHTAARFSKYNPIIDNYGDPTQLGTMPSGAPRMVTYNQAQQEVGVGSRPSQLRVVTSENNAMPEPQEASPNAANVNPPGIAGGNPLGAEDTAQSNVKNMHEATTQALTSGDRLAVMRQAKEALKHVSGTGPKTEYTNQLKSLIASFGGPWADKAAGIDPENVNAYDELNKLLTQYAAQQPGAQGSDLRTIQATVGNPNVHMQPEAINTILNSLIGRENKNNAMMKAWAKASQTGKTSPNNFNNFALDWQDLDRRAFNMDDRSPEEAGTLMEDIDAAGQAENFNKSLAIARQYGYSPSPKKKSAAQGQ